MTFGKASSRAKTSSLRIAPSDPRRKLFFPFIHIRAGGNRSCRAPPAHYPSDFDFVFCEIARRVAIPAGGNGYGISEFEKGLRHRLGWQWPLLRPRDNQNAHSLGQWTAYRETRFVSAHLFKT